MEPPLVLAAAAVFLLAGAVKGTVGLGLPTVGLGLSTLFLEPRHAIALLIVPMIVANLWQVWRLGAGEAVPALRRYGLFIVTMVAGIWATTGLVAETSTQALLVAIGTSFILFSAVNLLVTPPPLPDRWDRPAQLAGGVAAGVLGGLTAIWAPPIVVYLAARQVGRDEFVRVLGLMFFLGGLPLLGGYARAGLLTGPQAALSVAMVLPVIAGFSLGERLRNRLPASRFRTLLLWSFLLLGLNLLRRGLVG